MNDYKIELGTQLNTKGLKEDVAKLDDKYKVKLGIDLKVNDIKKRIGDYNKNTNNAKLHLKVKLDTDDLKKQINKLNLSGASGGKGVTMTVDTTSLEDSLKEVKGLVTDIKTSLGTLDSKSGMKDFLSSINQIATALGKAENESDSLIKSLSTLSKKDFSVNFGVNMGGSNPIGRNTAYGNKVRNETLPQLKQQTSDLVKFYNGTYKESLNEFEVLQKMVSGTKLSNGDFFENFLLGKDSVVSRMSSGSLASQMQAYKQYMDMFKQAASLKGLDISGVTSSFSKTADDLIKDAQDVQTGANEMQDGFEKLKQVFGGNSINVEGISTQLDSIVADLDEIKVVLQGLSSGVSVDGLIQSFDRLSETIEKLVSNATLAKNVLGDGLNTSVTDNGTEKAIQDQKELAQATTQSANTVVQNEEKKQQAIKETAKVYDKISRDTSLVRDDADFQKTFEVSNQAAQKAQRHFQELLADEKAVVSVTEQFDNSNALQSFTVNIKRASGEVETLRYAMDKLNDEGDEGFNYQGASANDKSVEKQLEANIKKANDLQVKLDKIKSGYDDMGASKPIKDDNHIKSLEEQYKKVQAAIENVKNADNTAYASMVSNAEKEKAALENMVREFRNAENVATSLRSKDISTVKDTYASKLDVLISKMRKDGVYSSGFEKGAENLRSVLSNATDSSGLTRFLNGLDKLEAGYKRASASAKEFNQSQKVGINVSGLESKIADLQRISPQIDKFETEIDGAKVSVQSLLNDLKQINTQGDFSVVNSRFKAFVDSAKAAGITVAETSKKVKSIGDIKFDIEVGKIDDDVSKIHDKFNRLSNASDELCDSIRAVDAAYEKLDTASKLDTDDITNAKKLTDTYEAYVKVLKTANNELDIQARKETAQARSRKLEQDKETLKLNTLNWMNENTRAAKEYGTKLKELISLIDKVDDVGLKDVGRQIKNVQKTAQVMGKTGLTVFDKLKAKAKEYMTYLSAAELFMYAEQALREMFNTVKEIDTAMTGLYRVTDLTAAEYDALFNNMISSAKEYGATLNDIINATTDWVRAGFDANTSLGLAEVTTMYQHISDLDYATAAENLITAYNGFKDELNGAFSGDTVAAVEYIADIFNELDK